MGVGIFFISILAAYSTRNQQQNSYTFITLGILISLFPIYQFIYTHKKKFVWIFSMIIVIGSLFFIPKKTKFVIYRDFNDIKYTYTNESETYQKSLGLYRQELVPMGSNADYDSAMVFLKSTGKNFIWFGDAAFMGSIIGNSSPSPIVFYHPGLTYPHPILEPEKFKKIQMETFLNMEEKNTAYLMMEAQQSFMGAELHEFWEPLLPYCKVVRRFGTSKIFMIDPAFYIDQGIRKP
jgi:hypothetical protein